MAKSILGALQRRARKASRSREEGRNGLRVHPAFAVDPQIRPVPDAELRFDPRDALNQICDISDWRAGPMLDVLEELREPVRIHRKAWEYGKSLHGLDRLGAIRRDAQGVSIGAGAERPLFYLANHVDRITATDLYESQAEPWGWGSDFLRDPGAYAPFPFRSDGLVVRNMSGLELEFPSSSLDFVYTLSSIEHFGGHEAARTAMQEMARVTKPGGVVCVVTELVLSQESAPELFTIDGLREYLVHGSDLKLADSHIDLRISESLLAHPVHLVKESDLVSPHIVLTGWGETGAVWTSVILFFRK